MLAQCVQHGMTPARILEPTCGSGAFLRAACAAFPAAREVIGVEYQRSRYASALEPLVRADPRLHITYADAYALDFAALRWRSDGPLLVVGNPPWVTTAALGRLAHAVVQPPRSNFKGLRGLAARTGAANFDVAEFLALKVMRELSAQPLQLALLVKESVARTVLMTAERLDLGITWAELIRIDARASFGVAVDACCLLLRTQPQGHRYMPVAIRANFAALTALATFEPAIRAKPAGPIVFRQGIKHDAAAVFELRRRDGSWYNGYDQRVDIEARYIYPLRKARALHSGALEPTALIVPQRTLGEPTAALETQAPRLWRYLHGHAARLAARKSSIYRNAPPFALFGIGAYSFAVWKVAVAGFYAEPRFRLIGPQDERPVVLGDTAYFVGFECADDARAFARLCASPAVAAQLRARIVPGKRPITKALLDGIDWAAAAATLDDLPDRLRALLSEPLPV